MFIHDARGLTLKLKFTDSPSSQWQMPAANRAATRAATRGHFGREEQYIYIQSCHLGTRSENKYQAPKLDKNPAPVSHCSDDSLAWAGLDLLTSFGDRGRRVDGHRVDVEDTEDVEDLGSILRNSIPAVKYLD
jgi:hypothetical protein